MNGWQPGLLYNAGRREVALQDASIRRLRPTQLMQIDTGSLELRIMMVPQKALDCRS
jgi:hypothetical protein